MKILFLSKSPDATAYYRVEIPAKYLSASGRHEVRQSLLEPAGDKAGFKMSDVEWAEVVVFQRPLTKGALKLLHFVKERHPEKVLVGDYDDDYFSVPRWNPGYAFVKANEPFWSKMLDLYDGITVSTLNLAEVIEKKTAVPVATIPNGFDFEEFDKLSPCQPLNIQATVQNADGRARHEYQITNEQFNELMQDRTVVAWAGSRFHYVDIDYLSGVIADVVKADPSIVFLFVGYIQCNVLSGVPISHLFTCAGRYPASEFYRLLKSFKIDIALAPLEPCSFNGSKSALKILEAMATGAYPICSDFDPYEDDLDPEAAKWEEDHYQLRHGRLVDYDGGHRAWVKAILDTAALMRDAQLKKKMRQDNDLYVRSRHSAESRVFLYEQFFNKLLDAKGPR